MRQYCYFRQSLFPHYCTAVRSSLLNLLKRQLFYVLFDGEISSRYDALACMPDAKKGRMIKAILERLRRLPYIRIVLLCILRESAVAAIGFSISLFRLCTITQNYSDSISLESINSTDDMAKDLHSSLSFAQDHLTIMVYDTKSPQTICITNVLLKPSDVQGGGGGGVDPTPPYGFSSAPDLFSSCSSGAHHPAVRSSLAQILRRV